jgi:hypothetical protein
VAEEPAGVRIILGGKKRGRSNAATGIAKPHALQYRRATDDVDAPWSTASSSGDAARMMQCHAGGLRKRLIENGPDIFALKSVKSGIWQVRGSPASCPLCTTPDEHGMPWLGCDGGCKCYFHPPCVSIAAGEYARLIASEEEWSCPQCAAAAAAGGKRKRRRVRTAIAAAGVRVGAAAAGADGAPPPHGGVVPEAFHLGGAAAAAGAAATEMVSEAAAVDPAETGTAATTVIYHPIL